MKMSWWMSQSYFTRITTIEIKLNFLYLIDVICFYLSLSHFLPVVYFQFQTLTWDINVIIKWLFLSIKKHLYIPIHIFMFSLKQIVLCSHRNQNKHSIKLVQLNTTIIYNKLIHFIVQMYLFISQTRNGILLSVFAVTHTSFSTNYLLHVVKNNNEKTCIKTQSRATKNISNIVRIYE